MNIPEMNVRYLLDQKSSSKISQKYAIRDQEKNPRNFYSSVREAVDQRKLTMKNYFLETQRDGLRSVSFVFGKRNYLFAKVPSKS